MEEIEAQNFNFAQKLKRRATVEFITKSAYGQYDASGWVIFNLITNFQSFCEFFNSSYFFIDFTIFKNNKVPKKRIQEIPTIVMSSGLVMSVVLAFSKTRYNPNITKSIEIPIPNKGLYFFIVFFCFKILIFAAF